MYSYNELDLLDKKYDGRPFYILKSDTFKETFLKLEQEFKSIYPNFKIAYSYKTNYTHRFCEIVNDLGGIAEVVSDMELYLARKIGVAYENIIYNGPFKGDLQYDLLENGGVVILDNMVQLYSVINWAKKNPNKIGNIALRINFELIENNISRFGFDLSSKEFDNVIHSVLEQTNLLIKGIHCHFSGARSVEAWKKRVKTLIGVAKNKLPYMPQFIDLGSGMYGEMNDKLSKQFSTEIPSFSDYANAVANIMKEEFCNMPLEQQPTLIVEPGTTLVANAMHFVSKVLYIKDVRGKTFIGTNSSIHNLGELCTKKNLPLEVISSNKQSKVTCNNADIVGYTCLEYDKLYSGFNGNIAKDDFIIFENVGSYSVVLKPPFIFPQCAIVEGTANGIVTESEIKRPETFEDIFNTFNI